MSDMLRWTISELVARYELEPQLKDVFVEGTVDREILSNAPKLSQDGYRFYEIDTVDVPREILERHGLTSGNKQRVTTLAKELAIQLKNTRLQCLVDRDLDHWFGPLEVIPRLRRTLFCSLELHFLTANAIRDVLVTTGRIKVKNFDSFVDSFCTALRSIYALRLTDRQLSMNIKWVSLKKYLSRDGDTVRFNADSYKTSLLASNSLVARKSEFDHAYSSWLADMNCDVRLCSRGHDFQTLLAWAMGEFNGQREFATEPAIERLFVFMARSTETLTQEVQ
jgi:hypothetical protein